MTVMAPVELLGISGKKPAHDGSYRRGSRSEKEVGMIREQRPGITTCRCLRNNGAETVKKVPVIPRISEYRPFFNTPHDNMMKGTGDIYARFPGHEGILS